MKYIRAAFRGFLWFCASSVFACAGLILPGALGPAPEMNPTLLGWLLIAAPFAIGVTATLLIAHADDSVEPNNPEGNTISASNSLVVAVVFVVGAVAWVLSQLR